MKLTVLGAGAMGTLYAAKLAAAGHAVTVVARGARRQSIEARGLVLQARGSTQQQVTRVPVVERLSDTTEADFILVFLRTQQLEPVMEALLAARGDVVTLVNTAAGYGAWRARLGARLLAAFPGATATLAADGVLTWELAPRLVQPTVLGEVDGPRSERTGQLAAALRSAGFPVQERDDMERWIRTHAAWISPFMLTAAAGADALTKRSVLERWLQATREALRSVRASGPLAPSVFGALTWLPIGLLAWIARQVLRSTSLRLHVASAGATLADEGRVLATELLTRDPALPALRELLDRP